MNYRTVNVEKMGRRITQALLNVTSTHKSNLNSSQSHVNTDTRQRCQHAAPLHPRSHYYHTHIILTSSSLGLDGTLMPSLNAMPEISGCSQRCIVTSTHRKRKLKYNQVRTGRI